MDRIPIDSSNLADVGYDQDSMLLEVGFRNGTAYQYFDVPYGVYQEFMAATSKGTYFNANIRKNYRQAKL